MCEVYRVFYINLMLIIQLQNIGSKSIIGVLEIVSIIFNVILKILIKVMWYTGANDKMFLLP